MLQLRPSIDHTRPDFFGKCQLTEAVQSLSGAEAEARGAIYTRPEVVEFMLDLAGYDAASDLVSMRLLEPSFGEGDFLVPAAKRLLDCWSRKESPPPVHALGKCIRAVELHSHSFEITRKKLLALFSEYGVELEDARELLGSWLIYGDFLLAPLDGHFDVVVGNPPYVRQEALPDILVEEYRERYSTIYDRADLYIPFFERSLLSLTPLGKLAFICADRWTKNRYGGPLRRLVATKFHVSAYVDMDGTDAFFSDVSAYPAITLIDRTPSDAALTRYAAKPSLESKSLRDLALALRGDRSSSAVQTIKNVASDDEPWLFGRAAEMQIVRRLEERFPLIEDTGCKFGIGVATGADKAFIADFDQLDVEPDRKLPLAMTRDIVSGQVEWKGKAVVNPFSETGELVDLNDYPKLKAYLEANYDAIANRHVAKKAPHRWYKTIDRIYPDLAKREKLLIPDIKGEAHIVFEGGHLYPHHNLYYAVSQEWDLRALQAVLLSRITKLMISTYSTKMRGGYLRFQAQYLRRLRLPLWSDVAPNTQAALKKAAEDRNLEACNEATFDLYGISAAERQTLMAGAPDGA